MTFGVKYVNIFSLFYLQTGWEMDLAEANKYALAVTPHECSAPPGGYISSCDGGGCGTHAHSKNKLGMCPNNTCIINTQQPFQQKVSFMTDTIHVELIQNGKTFDFDVCGKEQYIEEMNEAFSYGMTLVGSYWGNDYNTMKWLDGDTGCQGNCTGQGTAKFGDIQVYDIQSF